MTREEESKPLVLYTFQNPRPVETKKEAVSLEEAKEAAVATKSPDLVVLVEQANSGRLDPRTLEGKLGYIATQFGLDQELGDLGQTELEALQKAVAFIYSKL